MYVNHSYYCSQAFVLGFNAELIRESEVCKTMMKDNTFGKKGGGQNFTKRQLYVVDAGETGSFTWAVLCPGRPHRLQSSHR